MKLEKISKDGNELTRHAFISHVEDYIKQLLTDPKKASVSSYLASHGFSNEEFLPYLLKRADKNDENSAILIRKEHIKTNPETGKDSFSIKYLFPRENSYKKMRNLYVDLFENYQTDYNLLNESALDELDQDKKQEKETRALNFRFSPDALMFNGKLCNVSNGFAFISYIVDNNLFVTISKTMDSIHNFIDCTSCNCRNEILNAIRRDYLNDDKDDDLSDAVRDFFAGYNPDRDFSNRNSMNLDLEAMAKRRGADFYDLPPEDQKNMRMIKNAESKLLNELFQSYHLYDGRFWLTSEIHKSNNNKLSVFSESIERIPEDAIVFAFWNKKKSFNSHQGASSKIDIIKKICDEKKFDINKCYILSNNNNEIVPVANASNMFLSDCADDTELELMRQQHVNGQSQQVQSFKKQAANTRDANIEKQHPGKTIAQINYEKGFMEETKKKNTKKKKLVKEEGEGCAVTDGATNSSSSGQYTTPLFGGKPLKRTIYMTEAQLNMLKEEAVMNTPIGNFGYDAPASVCGKNDPAMKRHNGKGGSISVNTVNENNWPLNPVRMAMGANKVLKNVAKGASYVAGGLTSCTPMNPANLHMSHGMQFPNEKEQGFCDFYYTYKNIIDNTDPDTEGVIYDIADRPSKSCGDYYGITIVLNRAAYYDGKKASTNPKTGYYSHMMISISAKIANTDTPEVKKTKSDFIAKLKNSGYQIGDVINYSNPEYSNYLNAAYLKYPK